MYNRFLFIGLGGSGGKTLRFLKDQIQRWMKAHGIEGDIPSGWQFLHIDAPPQPDGDEINDRVAHLAGDEYVGLVPVGITFDAVQAQLDASDARRAELRTWRVEPTGLRIPIEAGAGQYRAVGHSIGTLYLNDIRTRIESKFNSLSANAAARELNYAYARAQGTDAAPMGGMPTYVFVVSSLAGGTGAGLLNNVCDLIRSMDAAAGSNLFGIIYTSEVFNVLPAATRAGVHGNGLAAVCELLNGYWWGGNPTAGDDVVVEPIDDPFLQAAGAVGTLTFGGPSYPFLVGLQNAAGVNFGTFDALFEGVGRALLSWVTDEEVAGSFVSYTIANFKNAASSNVRGEALVDLGETGAIGLPPFSALGFARISLGTDHFERYAVDRVVRDSYEHLVGYHFGSDDAKRVGRALNSNDPEFIAGKLAENHGVWFRGEVGIDETDFEPGPMRRDLWPPAGSIDRTGGLCLEYQRQISQGASLDAGGTRVASEWRGLIDAAVEDYFGDYAQQARADLDERSRAWVADVEGRVLSAVGTALVRYGLRVTARLCSDAASHLRTAVVNNLRSDVVADLRHWADQWREEASQELQGAGGRLRADDARLRKYLETAIHHRSFELDALVAERAADLASEAADRLFDPIAQALGDAFGRLRNDERSGTVDFGPPENEFSLIEVSEYQELFDRLLRQTFGGSDYGRLREAVIGCTACDPQSGDRFVDLARSWAPGARWSGASTNIDVAVCRTREGSARELLVRSAAAWLNDEGGPFGELLGLSLRDALDPGAAAGASVTAAERQEYQRRFVACVPAAIEAAAPLVDPDPTLAGLVGTDAGKGLVWHLSKLPFGLGRDGPHPMQAAVEDVLSPRIGADRVAELMTHDERRRHIDIATQLAAPQSVLALKSLLGPIAEDWGKQKGVGPVARQQFWEHRRARPLQRFVPVPQAHLRGLVRGWFTARILGLLEPSGTDGMILMAREDRSPVAFPNPSLSSAHRNDRLGPVLEALGLAYVEVAERGSLEPLEAYVQLLDLGKSGDRGILHYDSLNDRLARWIESGRRDPCALAGMSPVSLAGLSEEATWQDRAKAVAGVLDEVCSGYETEYAKLEQDWNMNPGKLSRAPLWTGLWPLIGEELQRLRLVVEGHTPDEGLR
ncbi:MAG: hypothetical protein OXE75_00310 [bacterium]|nr:hypothetical protein [bacterium]